MSAPNLPFRSVLVANRGEIALRVMRTARGMAMRSIAIYSDADEGAPHVRFADEAHCVGPAPARESYLDIEKIIAVAKQAKAGAIHPGYGFLSERAEFAEACAAAGIVFVGPPAAAIRAMGDKAAAKSLMDKARVPVVPGYHGAQQDPKFLRQKAYEIGYPVLIKAAAGGGGKGMRRVEKAIEFDDALAAASREAQSAFGDGRMLIEKWIERPRHIEVQVFGDSHGNVVHLFERDCSAQRRHQKVIEESPAPGMTPEVRAAMTKAAIGAARAVNYSGAGTVEFIASGEGALKPDGFWFLEMNTRLQVEHPVTEMVTGVDLVEWQFRVAAGEKLPKTQDQISLSGHAVEVRLYAEDPSRNFLPSTGRLHVLRFGSGEGVRVDAGVEQGQEISPYYDPMLAKIITHGPSRAAAFDRMAAVLRGSAVAGPRTNLAFLRALIDAPDVRAGKVDTGLIERDLAKLALSPVADHAAAAHAVEALVRRDQERIVRRAARRSNERRSPWNADDAFDFAGARQMFVPVRIDGERAMALVRFSKAGMSVEVSGVPAAPCELVDVAGGLLAVRGDAASLVELGSGPATDVEQGGADGVIVAPMHGKVLAIEVAKGDRVARGQRLAVIEAMKMEHALLAQADGVVEDITVEAGAQVAEGARLLVIQSSTAE
ncbi:MAG TPA: biotin carboxylase N-terminal domain-containing protein [Xanthobacteraceae bacterium]|nr:biotin carboxylase N-terminal domain-containing protein [Xanthobacteraceae bacterium]